MTTSKSILTVTSLAFVLMFGGGVFLLMNMGSIAKTLAQRIASDTLGVKVSIASVDVDLQNKAVTVNSVRVGNPAGYKGTYAATLDKIYMKADTLSQVLLRFNDISVTGSEVYLEVKPESTNLTDIKKTVDAKAAQGDKAAQQIKVIIENMRIEKMRVNPSVLLPGAPSIEPITVPDIVLRGIGAKENGVLASEAIAQVWGDVVTRTTRSANQAGFLEGLSGDALREAGVGQVQQIRQQIENTINEEAVEVEKRLKNFWGNE
jgi:hypothetical protein